MIRRDKDQLEARLIAWQSKIGQVCYEIGQFAFGIGAHSYKIRNASSSEHLEKELNSLDSFAHRIWNYKEWLSNYYEIESLQLSNSQPYDMFSRIPAQELIAAIKDEWPAGSNLEIREPLQLIYIKANKYQLARAIAEIINLLLMKKENKDAWLVVETYSNTIGLNIGLRQGIFGTEFLLTKENAISIASLFDDETFILRTLATAYKWIRFHKGEMYFLLYQKNKESIRILLPTSN